MMSLCISHCTVFSAGFYDPESPLFEMDLMMQRDITFIMHRTVELWKTWYTQPMPNIGTVCCDVM